MQKENLCVVSWNLGGAPAAGGTSLEQQRMAWDRLRGLDPDLVLLQEVQANGIPSWETEGWTILQGVVGRHVKQCRWGSIIAARRELQLVERDDVFAERGLQILYDYILAGQVRLPGGGDVFVATVHTPAKEVQKYLKQCKFDDAGLPGIDDLRRPDYPNGRPWLNDLAYRCLQRQVQGKRFIIGGDWNTARGFGDEGAAFFRRAEDEAWTDCHWVKNHKEVRTFLRKSSKPYQDDHLFCDRETGKRLLACRVIAEKWVGQLSDHAPLLAEFSTAKGTAESTAH